MPLCPVACPAYLLAMKSHALRYVPGYVAMKYLADALVRRTGGRVTDSAVRELCLRYGSRRFMTALSAPAIRTDTSDLPLEFPSGEGVRPVEHAYTVRQVLDLSQAWLPLVTSAPGFEVERLAAKCPLPFVLVP